MAAVGSLGAYSAVLCFLVVSGYSIAHSVGRRPDGFYRRRVRRIYPLYVLAVVAGLFPPLLPGGVGPDSPARVAANLLFLQTYRAYPVSGNPIVWTLAVEVALYAAAPALARLSTAALVGLTAASAAAFGLVYPRLGLPYYVVQQNGTPLLFLAWAWLGGFAFYRARDHWAGPVALLVGPVVLTTLNPTYADPRSMITLAGGMAVIVAAPRLRPAAAAPRRALAFLGDLSYPLYLFHAPLLITYVRRFHGHSPAVAVGGSVVVAAAMLGVDVLIGRPLARANAAVAARLPGAWDWAARWSPARWSPARRPTSRAD